MGRKTLEQVPNAPLSEKFRCRRFRWIQRRFFKFFLECEFQFLELPKTWIIGLLAQTANCFRTFTDESTLPDLDFNFQTERSALGFAMDKRSNRKSTATSSEEREKF
eukprot:Gregarina_sp_Poly_1__7901@NODE_44_length_17989_cov_118_013391_g38_i0_p12_GENE_NODE_44_length_17989_cov_118_013391_g38_i0NODE_44_length_17989_cov_118_013391_g38_i0_p12_ORF_typecomplete_len107_score10_75_NODE_44_length_17989_cov_118_013391_g38_i01106311383